MNVFNVLLFPISILLIALSLVAILMVINVILKTKRASILVVEDQEVYIKQLKEFLEDRNFSVSTASTVEQAKQLIAGQEFDYATIDPGMRGQGNEWEGIEILKLLKEKQPTTKLIIVSSHKLDDLKQAGFDQEAEETRKNYVFKGDPNRNYILAVLDMLNV